MAKDTRIFVAITNIKHGTGEVDSEGVPVFYYINSGDQINASDFPSKELLDSLIESGSVAEYTDVIVVEDTARVEELTAELEVANAKAADVDKLTAENADLLKQIADLQAAKSPAK